MDPHDRVAELERLISDVRHDVAGALTPALMVADSLQSNADPKVQRAGSKIADSILRATKLLKATRATVPPVRHPAPPTGKPDSEAHG